MHTQLEGVAGLAGDLTLSDRPAVGDLAGARGRDADLACGRNPTARNNVGYRAASPFRGPSGHTSRRSQSVANEHGVGVSSGVHRRHVPYTRWFISVRGGLPTRLAYVA